MLHEAPLRGLTGAIRERTAPAALDADPATFLRRFGVSGEDLASMASPQGAERMLVYRALVHNRFRGAVEVSLPRTAQTLGAKRLVEQVSAFIDERASSSAYLRDIAAEFVAWAIPLWEQNEQIAAYLPDLARHELLTFELAGAMDEPIDDHEANVDIDRPLVFRGPVRLERYDFSVHRQGDEEPIAGTVHVLAYRDAEDVARFLELSEAAASILGHLLPGQLPLRLAIERGCRDAGLAVDDALLAGAAELLSDLAERGVLLGSRPHD